MIHPQGAGVSSEELTTGLVVVGGAAVVVGDGTVVVDLGALVVVVLGGRLVVVEDSATTEDSEGGVLVVVVLAMGSLVELAIGRDALGPPDPLDPHAAPTRAAVARNPAIAIPRSSALLGGILTSVGSSGRPGFRRTCHIGHRDSRIKRSSPARRRSLGLVVPPAATSEGLQASRSSDHAGGQREREVLKAPHARLAEVRSRALQSLADL